MIKATKGSWKGEFLKKKGILIYTFEFQDAFNQL